MNSVGPVIPGREFCVNHFLILSCGNKNKKGTGYYASSFPGYRTSGSRVKSKTAASSQVSSAIMTESTKAGLCTKYAFSKHYLEACLERSVQFED